MTLLNQKLSLSEINVLNNFLTIANKDANANDKRDILWLDGYLCAINSSLALIKPSEWFDEIKSEDFEFENLEQAETMMLLVMRFYNGINKAIRNNSYVPIYDWHKFEDAPKLELAARWAKGYLLGTMIASEELLSSYEVNVALMPIVIASGKIPDTQLAKDGFSRAEMVDKIPKAVPLILALYNIVKDDFGGQDTWVSTTVVNDNKIGRNDLCSCGSGKKYKKCCLVKKTTFN